MEQVVAVRPARRHEAGIAVEQRLQRGDVARLDRPERAPERLPALGRALDVPAERRPACEPVLAREHEASIRRAHRTDVRFARARQRGVVLAHDRDAVREPARDHAAEALRAIFVVGDVVDERVREARAQAHRHGACALLASEILGLLAQVLQARGGG
jgi:hypothetical protein